MKKIYLAAIAVASSIPGGNVGIGTSMKSLILSIAMLIAFNFSYAQTLQDITDNGAVTTKYIGTAGLDVNGNGIDLGNYHHQTASFLSLGLKGLRLGYNSLTNNAFIAPVESQSLGIDISTYYNSTWSPKVTFKDNGNVGIGRTSPGAKLEIYGSSQFTAELTDAGGRDSFLALNSANADAGSGGAVTFGNVQGISAGSLGFAAIKGLLTNGGGNTVGDLAFATRNDLTSTALTERMRITSNGHIGIGTTTPDELLSVNGTIHSKEVKVNLTGLPDYVFKLGYTLPTLAEVKNYIDKNNHLPEIPSAQEVEKYGLNLGEMNKLLLKKVEELTLYLIEKDKEVKDQQLISQAQQNQIDELRQQMKVLLKKKSLHSLIVKKR